MMNTLAIQMTLQTQTQLVYKGYTKELWPMIIRWSRLR